MKFRLNEEQPTAVPQEAKQVGEARPERWGWVERSVWTERMLEALEQGVKGGMWFSLIDKVYRPETLYKAWTLVKANRGGAGADHQTIEGFERNLEGNLERLHEELRTGTYQPRFILRVYIEKEGSRDKRSLGIPSVRDRVVQTALRLVIEPIFERVFHPRSFGFRPGRGCKDALREVDRLLKGGHCCVVDADLQSYFDSIPHDQLMSEIRCYIADGRVLKLIEGFFKQGIVEGFSHWTPEEGTPQGAVISPLLANLYLHSLDVAMAEAGFQMVRYADDFVVLCQSDREARMALERMQSQISMKGLRFHPEKIHLVDVRIAGQRFDFLGYRFEGATRWPRKKSVNKVRNNIRAKTGRSSGKSLPCIIAEVNRTLRGWFEYFKHSNKRTFPGFDQWIRRRLRSILRRRLKGKGISGGYDHIRWPKRYFREHGLFSLEEAHGALLQPSVR